MKIQNITYSVKNNKARLSGELKLQSGKTHTIFFEVDAKYKDFIAHDASAFLAAGLGISMKKNEDLLVEGSVSKKLMKNVPDIVNIVQGWEPFFHKVSVRALHLRRDSQKSTRVGCFFSGGVDSFYTHLQNKKKVSHLIFVHGFDISLKEQRLYKSIEKNIKTIAEEERVELITVKTNIRETFEQYFNWDLSHEYALAAVSLFLRKGLREIFMSCGQTDDNAAHHYMSPEVDALWSTERMKTHHFGCSAGKISKVRFLANYAVAMKNLRVCWINRDNAYNCCECEKCLRNMLALYVTDSLDSCSTFKKGLQLDLLEHLRLSKTEVPYYIALLDAMKKKHHQSAERIALEKCIKNNQSPGFIQGLYRKTRDFLRMLDNKYNSNRLYWYLVRKSVI